MWGTWTVLPPCPPVPQPAGPRCQARTAPHADAGGGITAFSRDGLEWAYTCDLTHRAQLNRHIVPIKLHDLLRSSHRRHWDDGPDASSRESRGIPRPHRALARSFRRPINGKNFVVPRCVAPAACLPPRRAHTGQALLPLVGSGIGRSRRGSAAGRCCGRQSFEGAGGFQFGN